MRKPRHLSPQERALWDRVAARAKPLDPRPAGPARDATPAAPPRKPKVAAPETLPFKAFDPGSASQPKGPDHDTLSPLAERLRAKPVQMDAKSYGRMSRGKLKPEGRIDLHGMTLAEAHPALTDFILWSHAMGRRLVLVITGKGKVKDDGGPMPARHGVLRHQVPQWLALPPLVSAVLEVRPAHIRHGGEGAYYVYLRRRR